MDWLLNTGVALGAGVSGGETGVGAAPQLPTHCAAMAGVAIATASTAASPSLFIPVSPPFVMASD
jgi:hypothetical protein